MARYKVSEMQLTQEQVESIAESYSITPWSKTGKNRYYLNMGALQDLIGLTVDYYNTGNVRDCYYTGADGEVEDVANRRAWSNSSYGGGNKAFIEDGKVFCDWSPYDENIAELIALRISERF